MPLVGKAWLVLVVFLRILVLLFAGYPLFQDEQERFVCNTIQPGCANVCYDMFAPLSLVRFWLVQLTTLCLPYAMFVIYAIHKVSSGLPADSGTSESINADSIYKIHQESFRKASLCKTVVKAEKGRVQCFTGAYILHLLLRILVEAGFGAAHYYLFGFHIPKRFMCQQPPCTTMVDCYISRPTEKTITLNFMLGAAALSLLLNVCDLICAVKRSMRQKSKGEMLEERIYAEEQYYLSGNGNRGVDISIQPTQDVMGPGGFRKRGTRNSSGNEAASVLLDDDPPQPSPLAGMPTIAGMPGSNNNDDSSSYQPTQEEGMVREGSEVALYPSKPLGTPRSVQVSKRSRPKPPPPPRRDKLAPQGAIDVSGATAVCTRRAGQYTLVEITTGEDVPTCNGDGQEKRSEWV
ncbi:gap junction delta-4 protein-like [Sinocyclocheilus grahami]|uniref:gap junction delta-4 protein-like n=1 Tax=Sinocyclocheilus grahami TaxID=75366 RepID=UPI0007ACDAB5|nr:PREDICTED: gap junction delta-4 protein-like [Sinocyclocheilus grahami]